MPIAARGSVWLLVIDHDNQLKNFGSRYHLFIVNVLSVTPIFGKLTKKCYQANDIGRLARRAVRLIILNVLTIRYANGLAAWFVKVYHFLRK